MRVRGLLVVLVAVSATSCSAAAPSADAPARRLLVPLDVAARLSSTPFLGIPNGRPTFVPTLAQAKQLEREMPAEFAAKYDWSREDRGRTAKGYTIAYVGFTERGHKKLFGKARLDWDRFDKRGDETGADLLSSVTVDGGCGVLHMIFDLETRRFNLFECNGPG